MSKALKVWLFSIFNCTTPGGAGAGAGAGGVLPYMGCTSMCRCDGYGFQAVYSWIGYINQSIWL